VAGASLGGEWLSQPPKERVARWTGRQWGPVGAVSSLRHGSQESRWWSEQSAWDWGQLVAPCRAGPGREVVDDAWSLVATRVNGTAVRRSGSRVRPLGNKKGFQITF
jgi:hypothetical protein